MQRWALLLCYGAHAVRQSCCNASSQPPPFKRPPQCRGVHAGAFKSLACTVSCQPCLCLPSPNRQAVEPSTLVPLAHGGAKQVYLVGDPVQLPATVMSQVGWAVWSSLDLMLQLDAPFQSLQRNNRIPQLMDMGKPPLA